jgi:hypothetical protein
MLGTMKVGHIELPITRIRLAGGKLEFTGEIPWLAGHVSPYTAQVDLFGVDGQQVKITKPSTAEIAEGFKGDRFSVVLPVSLDAS